MIYYIVAVDPATHNEWIMSTHDSVVSATKYCDEYRKQKTEYEYRIDTAEQNLKGLMEEAAKSWNRNPFTAKELFPPSHGGRLPSSNCAECGAYVTIPHQNKHAEWHNKVADL
jgi:hypothetical protein